MSHCKTDPTQTALSCGREPKTNILFSAAYANFYGAPTGCDSGKARRKTGKNGSEKRNKGIVCAIVWCAQALPPSFSTSPNLHVPPQLPTAMVIRTGGKVGKSLPPPYHPHPIAVVRGCSGGSLGQPLTSRL
jgi:hypothetical protein